jgi:hypothetical protein
MQTGYFARNWGDRCLSMCSVLHDGAKAEINRAGGEENK